jgi:hypothetical protein
MAGLPNAGADYTALGFQNGLDRLDEIVAQHAGERAQGVGFHRQNAARRSDMRVVGHGPDLDQNCSLVIRPSGAQNNKPKQLRALGGRANEAGLGRMEFVRRCVALQFFWV